MIQHFFKTGKTIVIDDQYNEAKPLLDALCKNQIPFVYTQGKPNSDFPLPSSSEFFNLIFLDLNLDFKFATGGLSENDEKTFKSTHSHLLDTILRNTNSSFIIVIWSNEEEDYFGSYMKIFDSLEKYRTTKMPYRIISLSKTEFFTKEKEDYIFKPGKELELKNKISEELSDIEAFKLFCEWDGITSESAGALVDDFMSLVNHIVDNSQKEEHLAKALTCLAVAYTGEDRYLMTKDNNEKTKAVMYVLSQMFIDDIDRNIFEGSQSGFKNWSSIKEKNEIKSLKEEIKYSLLNRKLLQFKTKNEYLINSVYYSRISGNHNSIFSNIYNGATKKSLIAAKEIYKKENNGLEPANMKQFELNLKNYIKNRIDGIEVDVTPACDISNDKAPIHRMLLGLAIPKLLLKCFDLTPDYLFKSPVFEIEPTLINQEKEEYFIVLDFRYLVSRQKKDLKLKNYLFSLRTNLVNDIQVQLASHVSRLGTLNL